MKRVACSAYRHAARQPSPPSSRPLWVCFMIVLLDISIAESPTLTGAWRFTAEQGLMMPRTQYRGTEFQPLASSLPSFAPTQ